MAGRKPGFRHSEKTREKIKTTQLTNRLQSYVLGEIDQNTGEPVEMKPAQVNAAKVLLDKTLPSLSMSDVLQHQGDEKTPEELFSQLSAVIGEDLAKQLFPDFKRH